VNEFSFLPRWSGRPHKQGHLISGNGWLIKNLYTRLIWMLYFTDLGGMLTSSNNLLTDMVHMPYVASSISKTARFGFCNSQFCSSSLSFITPVVSLVTLVRKID